MLKILKWGFTDFIKRTIWLYVGILAAFALVMILTSKVLLFSGYKQGLGLAFCLLLFIVSVILSMKALCGWLGRDSVQLEMFVPVKPSLLLMGKWILAVCVGLAGLLLACFTDLMIAGRCADIVAYLPDIACAFIGMVLFLSIVQFSNLLVHSSQKARRHFKLFTVLLAFLLFLVASGILIFILTTFKLWIVSSEKPGELMITLNRQKDIAAAIFGVIIPFTSAFGVFTGSCAIFKNKFEC